MTGLDGNGACSLGQYPVRTRAFNVRHINASTRALLSRGLPLVLSQTLPRADPSR